jgi:lantibiotic transport system permease protein
MTSLLRALDAELLKLKGTLARRLCWLAPLIVVALYVAMLLVRDFGDRPTPPPDQAWLSFATECLGLWTFLMLPLFVTLQSALLAGLEHGDRQWKHLLALPCPRAVHYVAKGVVLLGMTLAAVLALALFVELGGHLVAWLRPSIGLRGAGPHAFLLDKVLRVFLLSTLMIALHTWIAIRWASFTVAVAAGMSATVVGFLVMQSPDYRWAYPWSMAVQVLSREGPAPSAIPLALAGALLVFALGAWDFSRREM